RPEFVAGAEDLLQPRRGVGLPLEVLDHGFGPALLPLVQRRLDQGVSVLEVPVEAALGRTQLGGDGLDGAGIDAAAGDCLERRLRPVVGGERALSELAHQRTVPYGRPYGTVWSPVRSER